MEKFHLNAHTYVLYLVDTADIGNEQWYKQSFVHGRRRRRRQTTGGRATNRRRTPNHHKNSLDFSTSSSVWIKKGEKHRKGAFQTNWVKKKFCSGSWGLIACIRMLSENKTDICVDLYTRESNCGLTYCGPVYRTVISQQSRHFYYCNTHFLHTVWAFESLERCDNPLYAWRVHIQH